MRFSFQLLHTDSETNGRLGLISTAHGTVETPAFMPVGTRGVVKTVSPSEIADLGYEMVLCNAYHLYLRPGHDPVERFGGLHRFMDWDGAILTDSGGFQVFSLAKLRKIGEEGVLFQSHIDGSPHLFSPELSIEVQESLGTDIIMCLDDVRGYPVAYDEAVDALERTNRWAERCIAAKKKVDPGLFGIVQGSAFSDLRRLSAESLVSFELDGYAIGGLSVGEPGEVMVGMIEATVPHLPENRPRYLMGVGKPGDILDGVVRGVDLFDCVIPTRNARNGTLFTSSGTLNIKNSRHRDDFGPVDPLCTCTLCRRFSRAYLRHLFLEREVLGLRLATIHNLAFYGRLMQDIREAVRHDRLRSFVRQFYADTEEPND